MLSVCVECVRRGVTGRAGGDDRGERGGVAINLFYFDK